MPWDGPWHAELELELEVPVPVLGPNILTIDTTVLRGTVDERASGRFNERAMVRFVAGGAGWHKSVLARHWHNDAGIISNVILAATAAEVGEQLVQAVPKFLGTDYARLGGPASQALAGLDWYVNELGVTIVGPRLPLPAHPDVTILSWDAKNMVAELETTAVVPPGTLLVDPVRFGTAMVADVEMTFSGAGGRATAYCRSVTSKPGGRLGSAFAAAVKQLSRGSFLQERSYRVIAVAPDGRYVLQALEFFGEWPDMMLVSAQPGVAGARCKPVPGTKVSVVLLDGDPAQPRVVGWEDGPAPPLEVWFRTVRTVCGPAGTGTESVAKASAVLAVFEAIAAAPNHAAIAAAISGLLPAIPSTNLFTDG
jgi:hypothetical protein